jgi:hypothetical protein
MVVDISYYQTLPIAPCHESWRLAFDDATGMAEPHAVNSEIKGG